MKTCGFVTRSQLHPGTRSSLLSRALWEGPLANFLLLDGSCPEICKRVTFEVNLPLPGCHLYDLPRDVVPAAFVAAEKCGSLFIVTWELWPAVYSRCLLGNVVPSVSLDGRKTCPHRAVVPPLNTGKVMPSPYLLSPRMRSSQDSHCMLGDLIRSGQLPYLLHIEPQAHA